MGDARAICCDAALLRGRCRLIAFLKVYPPRFLYLFRVAAEFLNSAVVSDQPFYEKTRWSMAQHPAQCFAPGGRRMLGSPNSLP